MPTGSNDEGPPRNQLPHGSKGVLENQARDISSLLILSHELYRNRSTQALAINDDLTPTSLLLLTDVIQTGLCVDHETFLIGSSSG